MPAVERVAENDFHEVWRFKGRLLGANHYLVHDKQRQDLFAIDSGFGGSLVHQVANEMKSQVSAVYLTHGHFDHGGGAAYLSDSFSCPSFLNARDLRTIHSSNFLLKVLGYDVRMRLPELVLVENGFHNESVEFLDCPGHTPGSVLVRVGEYLFTGDSVYADRIDVIALPGQDDKLLYDSLWGLLDDLLDAAVIFPGHGRSIGGKDLLDANIALRSKLNQR